MLQNSDDHNFEAQNRSRFLLFFNFTKFHKIKNPYLKSFLLATIELYFTDFQEFSVSVLRFCCIWSIVPPQLCDGISLSFHHISVVFSLRILDYKCFFVDFKLFVSFCFALLMCICAWFQLSLYDPLSILSLYTVI